MKENKRVNFREDHELNNRLRSNELRQTKENREKLKELGKQTKASLNKKTLTHEELDKALEENKGKFD
ncbi:hypothetical protein [Vibrio coralliilyticus]|uniref:hypothetical protein n=1 Tax=Vibrio coralliilyticus TaxID=190893 RepID=UPI001E54CCA1|nr:hypothetical protein [Vibrio coralliilyticus]MCC2521092.1 hypothetical protein [Vibrio coralliilyticus]